MVGQDNKIYCDVCRASANKRGYLSVTMAAWPGTGDIVPQRVQLCTICANDADIMRVMFPRTATI